jgi:hypothetical protein
MKTAISLLLLAVIALSTEAFCQDASGPLPNAPSYEITNSNEAKLPDSPEQNATNSPAAQSRIASDQADDTNHHAVQERYNE